MTSFETLSVTSKGFLPTLQPFSQMCEVVDFCLKHCAASVLNLTDSTANININLSFFIIYNGYKSYAYNIAAEIRKNHVTGSWAEFCAGYCKL